MTELSPIRAADPGLAMTQATTDAGTSGRHPVFVQIKDSAQVLFGGLAEFSFHLGRSCRKLA